MTLEELANLTSDKLKALTDQQLNEILSPYYNVTRPEQVKKIRQEKNITPVYVNPQKKAALELLKEQGLDLSFMNKKRKL